MSNIMLSWFNTQTYRQMKKQVTNQIPAFTQWKRAKHRTARIVQTNTRGSTSCRMAGDIRQPKRSWSGPFLWKEVLDHPIVSCGRTHPPPLSQGTLTCPHLLPGTCHFPKNEDLSSPWERSGRSRVDWDGQCKGISNPGTWRLGLRWQETLSRLWSAAIT